MYNLHKTCEHDAWRNNLVERKAKAGHTNPKDSTTTSITQKLKPVEKLALSEYLRTALCTQDGLSSDAADHIWSDACRDSGNEQVQTVGGLSHQLYPMTCYWLT